MALLLSRTDVRDLFDMRHAIDCTEQALREQAQGRVHACAPFVTGYDTHELRVNAGALAGLHCAGLRFSMKGAGVAALYDAEQGQLECLMAYPFTYMRVGATVAVAVDRLADPSARRLMCVGTGRIALSSLEGISCLRRFDRIQVYSRQATNREGFCAAAMKQLQVAVEPVRDVEKAVSEADVVIVATNAEGPALRFAWLAPETPVATAGIRCEVDEETYLKAARVIVGSKVHEEDYKGWIDETNDNTLVRLAREGRLRWENIIELGELVSGESPPRAGISVFRDSQGGFGDLACAQWIFGEARKLGRGQTWDFSA